MVERGDSSKAAVLPSSTVQVSFGGAGELLCSAWAQNEMEQLLFEMMNIPVSGLSIDKFFFRLFNIKIKSRKCVIMASKYLCQTSSLHFCRSAYVIRTTPKVHKTSYSSSCFLTSWSRWLQIWTTCKKTLGIYQWSPLDSCSPLVSPSLNHHMWSNTGKK